MMEHKPRTKEDASSMISVPSREALGALLYLSIRTRPDIAVAVGALAKHVQEPHPLHWEGVNVFFGTCRVQRTKLLYSKLKKVQTH
jgi:hypothetical protein